MTAVQRAIKAGRIHLEPDGTIDPDRADREWAANTDSKMRPGQHDRSKRDEAIHLRGTGMTLKDIAAAIGVSTTSVFLWTKDQTHG